MELAFNSKLAFKLNATHVHCSEFNDMHVLVFNSTPKRGGSVIAIIGVDLNATPCV